MIASKSSLLYKGNNVSVFCGYLFFLKNKLVTYDVDIFDLLHDVKAIFHFP